MNFNQRITWKGGAFLVVAAIGAMAQTGATQPSASSKEWPTYNHDPGGMRFSPLTQVTPANVNQLKVAWVYHLKPAGAPVAPVVPEGRGPGGAVGDNPEPAGGGGGRGRG